MAGDWKATIHLPQTEFPMRGNLPRREPEFLGYWAEQRPYERWQEREGSTFVLHDGPPYANGEIHIGHALNKILKDIVVKYQAMSGNRVPYVPGWDCHGLPIETQVARQLGKKVRELGDGEFRRACREYAARFVDSQREAFRRLGVFGDWERPYLTMDYAYEAQTLRGLAALVERGLVYRMHRPVHWCPNCETALAEAEVEYEAHTSPSVFVRFPLATADRERLGLGGEEASLVIWTTTPWTLPANQAVAVRADASYRLVRDARGHRLILAEPLIESLTPQLDLQAPETEVLSGADLLGAAVDRPYHPTPGVVIAADFVELETGTGAVHIAPGHGHDDWLAGRAHDLAVESPVDARGRLRGTPVADGLPIFDANPVIVDELSARALLLRVERVDHQYPHCWRCHKPLLFRATDQWFVDVGSSGLRDKALTAIDQVRWMPRWGENRIRGMVEQRPDWCISRQRRWGVPIAVPFCEDCEKPHLDAGLMRHIADHFEQGGADVWFERDLRDLLPEGYACPHCGSERVRRETDILDVWFDSGISWSAVCELRDELQLPADLYLEGSDQHRGWFQSSLLLGVGIRDEAPFRSVLTHGFVVDGQGRKMSKSAGNVMRPQDIVDRYGADLLRLWVASEQFDEDVRASEEILKHVVDAYRRIRNTLRYLVSVLFDFEPARDAVRDEDLLPVDAWFTGRLRELAAGMHTAYGHYQFHLVYQRLVQFCAVDLSALFVDIARDRLYCSAADDRARRSAQTAAHEAAVTLIPLLAPILSFTAEEAWQHLPGRPEGSVFDVVFPASKPAPAGAAARDWDTLLRIRDEVLRGLEAARAAEQIGAGLEARIRWSAEGETAATLAAAESWLAEWWIVSQAEQVPADTAGLADTAIPGFRMAVVAAEGGKCARCWQIQPEVGSLAEPDLCRRCHEAAGAGVRAG